MSVEIREIGTGQLRRYAAIPIRFRVGSIFRIVVIDGGLGGFRLIEEAVDTPYVKDYDAQGGEGEAAGELEGGRAVALVAEAAGEAFVE